MNQPSTPAAQPVRTAQIQITEQLMALAGAAAQPQQVGDAYFVMVPERFTHKDITEAVEKAQALPSRKHGAVQVKDVDSLLAYMTDQKAADTGYVFADPDARTITAVFNDHRGGAGWRDHRAIFRAEYTPEFDVWLRNSKQPKDQTGFAEFIEDNLADIAEPAAHTLLEVATTIQATTGIHFGSAKRLQDGQTQLTYNESIDARAGAGGGLTIPKEFTLGLRIFKNGAGYLVKARLKYRLASGAIKFWYELDRPERSVEDAFKGYVDDVRAKSGYTVLLGAAG